MNPKLIGSAVIGIAILVVIILIVIGHTVASGGAKGIMLGIGYGMLGGLFVGLGSSFVICKLGSYGFLGDRVQSFVGPVQEYDDGYQ